MGVVYLAYDPLLEREVAVKVILSDQMTVPMRERFQREAKLLAQMDHPAIVPVHDVGEEGDILFYVMPFIDGASLRKYLKNRSLGLGELLDIGIQVAEALDYSHARRVIHRDIKPENILVQTEPGNNSRSRIRITDFGLATKIMSERVTEKGAIVGTVAYVSPEQISGKEMDARSDIYSLGVLLYEYLTGTVPFTGEFQVVLYRITYEAPVPPRMIGARSPIALEDLVMRSLEKDPARRPQSAKEFAENLREIRRSMKDSEIAESLPAPSASQTGRMLLLSSNRFVGREKEVSELSQRLNAAESGECQFVLIGGEAGIGKSRLAEEIEKLARVRRFRVLRGRFFEQDQSFPYQGFCEVIQEYLLSKESSDLPPKADFSDLGNELVSLFPVLSETEIFRTTSASQSKSGIRDIGNSTQIYELLTRAILRIASGHPLLIVLEDLHNTQTSPEALEYVVRRIGPTETLIIGTFRSTEVFIGHPLKRMIGNLQGERRFQVLNLNPLNITEYRKFLGSLLGGKKVEDGFTQKIMDATEGNPLFTVEFIRSLQESQKGEEGLSSDRELVIDALLPSIQNVVEKRVKRLPEDLREILNLASVLGKSFPVRDLNFLLEGKDSADDLLDRLIQDGFLAEERRAGERERLRFCSGVVQEILYASLSRRRRKSLHLRYAEELERRNAARLDRIYPQLLHHYSFADVAPKVVEYGLKFARKSLQIFSIEDAVRSLKMVLEYGEGLLESEARALLASAYRMSGNADLALQEFEEAIRLMEHSHDARLIATIYSATETAWEFRRMDDAMRWADRGMDHTRRTRDAAQLSRFLSLAATVANLRGEFAKANELLAELDQIRPVEIVPTEEVPEGGTLRVAVSPGVRSLDPARIQVAEEVEIAANVFETLLTTDPTGHLRAGLCERWDVQEEGRAFLLTLRQNVRFHDGNILVARDVKNSLERAVARRKELLPPALSAIQGVHDYVAGRSNSVAGIVPIYDNRVLIRLSHPLAIYPAFLTHLVTAIVREGNSVLYGTGPFQIDSQDEKKIVLRRNQDYWKGRGARLSELEFALSIPSGDIAKGLREGKFDLAASLLPDDMESILRDRGFQANLVENPKRDLYFVLFNRNRPACKEESFRKILCDAIHVHNLVRQTIGRFARPAEGIIPPGILGHDPSRRRYGAKPAVLQNKIRLNACCHPLIEEQYPAMLEQLLKSWKQLGIEVEILGHGRESYLQFAENNEEIDLMIGRWVADYDDPDTFTYGLFHSLSGIFRNYYSTLELDAMLSEGRHVQRPALRERIYRKIEEHLLNECVILPLFHGIDFRVAGPQLRNLNLSGVPPYVNYYEAAKTPMPETPAGLSDRGILTIPLSGDLKNLDPVVCAADGQSDVAQTVFETLTRQAEGGRIVPWLASAVQPEESGKIFRFWLRNNIRFHNGRTLNARDVRYSMERALQTGGLPARNLLSGIRGAAAFARGEKNVIDGFQIHGIREFSIELETVNPNFLTILTSALLAIVPEGTTHFEGSWREGCSGTGPFRVTRFEPHRRLDLQANPDYWRPGYPKCHGILFICRVSPAEILAGLKEDRFLLGWDLIPQDAITLRKDHRAKLQYAETPILSVCYLAMNIRHGILSDERIRYRIIEMIESAELVRKCLGGIATVAHGLIPPGLPGHQKRARKWKVESPVTEEVRKKAIKIAVDPVFDGPYYAFMERLMEIFLDLGIHSARVDSFENADVHLGRFISEFPDPDKIVQSLLHSRSGYYGTYFGDADLDDLIERAASEQKPAAKSEYYSEIEKRIRETQMLFPLFHEKAYRFARPQVQGFAVNYFSPVLVYENLSIQS